VSRGEQRFNTEDTEGERRTRSFLEDEAARS
jgi:hypothetical protein